MNPIKIPVPDGMVEVYPSDPNEPASADLNPAFIRLTNSSGEAIALSIPDGQRALVVEALQGDAATKEQVADPPAMIEQPAFLAKRSPDGYVAQRVAIGPRYDVRRPWVLTSLDEADHIGVQLLTDDEVADWAPLYDELVDGEEIEQDEASR